MNIVCKDFASDFCKIKPTVTVTSIVLCELLFFGKDTRKPFLNWRTVHEESVPWLQQARKSSRNQAR